MSESHTTHPAGAGADAQGTEMANAPAIPHADDLRTQIDELRTLFSAYEDELDSYQVARARIDMARARERLQVGGDHMVVALVGGTGSGKSSLFNALTESNFADSGEIRPTTEQPSAFAWGSDATELLDFLEIKPNRRTRDDALTDEQLTKDLRGMVLLDLPDHDSIEVMHSVLVERLLPLIDTVLWVLDPQKYADQTLHHHFLSLLRERADSMIVVLNHADRVPAEDLPTILHDVRELLAAGGVRDVPIIPTCALPAAQADVPGLENRGIDALYDQLRTARRRPGAAVRTALAEIAAVRKRLAPAVGQREADPQADLEVAGKKLEDSCGFAAVADAVYRVANTGVGVVSRPEPPSLAAIRAVRADTIRAASAGLPEPWHERMDATVPGADRIRRELVRHIDERGYPQIKTSAAARLIPALGALIAAAIALIALPKWPIAIAGALAAGAIVYFLSAKYVRRRRLARAQDAAEAYRRETSGDVQQVVHDLLETPIITVLGEHRAARQLLMGHAPAALPAESPR